MAAAFWNDEEAGLDMGREVKIGVGVSSGAPSVQYALQPHCESS